jgi:hypothetical protein
MTTNKWGIFSVAAAGIAIAFALTGCSQGSVSADNSPTTAPNTSINETPTRTTTPSNVSTTAATSSKVTEAQSWSLCLGAAQAVEEHDSGDTTGTLTNTTWPTYNPKKTGVKKNKDGSLRVSITAQAKGVKYPELYTCDVSGTFTSPRLAFIGANDLS